MLWENASGASALTWIRLALLGTEFIVWNVSKVSKSRACPAAGREIRSAECGENRNSAYRCPSNCTFNPLTPANYNQLLEIEQKVDNTVMELFAAEWQTRPWLMSKFNNAAQRNAVIEANALVNATVWFERDAAGQTPGGRFLEEGLPGLKNDHRVLFRAKSNLRVALFEVHQVIDDLLMRGVDLWRPQDGEILVADRALAARASRFTVMYAQTYALPALSRIHGAAFPITHYHDFNAVEVVEAILEHLKGPAPASEERRGWLIANAARVSDILTHTTLARNQQALLLSDTVFGIANYKDTGDPEIAAAKLGERDDMLPDEPSDQDFDEGFNEAWQWLENRESDGADGKHDVLLGQVLRGEHGWRVQATGSKRLAELRKRFENVMGASVVFESQKLTDLLTRPIEFDPEKVVSKLAATAGSVSFEASRKVYLDPGETPQDLEARMLAEHDRNFLEESIPALGGMTPRAAARDAAQRPKLIALMKERIRSVDERNLKSGRNESIDWMVEELGLKEIAFPPPPLRPIPVEYLDENGHDGFEELPPAPRLADQPLSGEEIAERLVAVGDAFESPEEHFEALRRAGGTADLDLDTALGDVLTEPEFDAAIMLIVKASFVMVPPGYGFPPVDMDRVFDDMKEFIERFNGEDLIQCAQGDVRTLQPTLVACLSTTLLNRPRKAMRPESAFVIGAFLAAYTNELHRQLVF
jgi:hypothetical protein